MIESKWKFLFLPVLQALVVQLFFLSPVAGFVAGASPQGAAAKPDQTRKIGERSKKSAKKRKKTRWASFWLPYLMPTVASEPVASSALVIEPTSSDVGSIAPSSRRGATAARAPGVHALPVRADVSTEIPTTTGQLIISEFRLSGPSGDDDEFIELYNTTGAQLAVQAADGSSGLGIAASDGNTRCVVPNGTLIPAGGHYLCAHTSNSLITIPDNIYGAGISENVGLAIFNNATGGASYTLANRLDAVGATTEMDAVYKEGMGYPAVAPGQINYSFYRDLRPNGLPKDTDDNASDFLFVDTNATSAGAGQLLGAPGAESLSSPIQQNANLLVTLIAPCTGAASAPNRVRDFTSDPENNSTFGTLSIRRLITNTTMNDITQLRFRIIDITTFPAPAGVADLRARNSLDSIESDPCHVGGIANISGLALDSTTASDDQTIGGGFNSTLSAGTITLSTPLPPNSTISVNFLLGIEQTGYFRFFVNVEALP